MTNVSTLTRPKGRVLPRPGDRCARPYGVSTLTRPKGRVLLVSTGPSRLMVALFQPSPARKGGCYAGIVSGAIPRCEFQPSPARKGGCYA